MAEAGGLTRVRVIAAVRCAVGAGLLVAPDAATSADRGRRILARTIGIRDLVLGAGTLLAARADVASEARKAGARLWLQATLSSDVADVLLALGSRRELGTRGTLLAALTPLPFVVLGGWALQRGDRT